MNQDLDEVLPNRNNFINDLFRQSDLYTTGPTAPTAPTPTAPTPTAPTPTAPTPTGGGGDSCEDSPLRFQVTKDGKKISRDCTWVANRATNSRCKLNGVSTLCPSTCNTCDTCVDGELRFKFEFKDKGKITRGCDWVANKNTNGRCRVEGMKDTCRETCNNC